VIDASLRSGDSPSGNSSDYRKLFVARVHEVVEQGYRRLNAAEYAAEEEPAITGELANAMTAFLRGTSAPEWADNFSVHDDPPVSDGARRGKRRRRVDIRVDASTPRPGARFSYEAKRLASGHGVSEYLGKEGLGCFLSGDYAREDAEAGMLGYMQSRDAECWSTEIETALRKNKTEYEISGTVRWQRSSFPRGPEQVFQSNHTRNAVGRPIEIYHTLLAFHGVRDDGTSETARRSASTAGCKTY
jgi:hypothetical protein